MRFQKQGGVKMILTTSESIPGKEVSEYVGLVWSSSARSKNLLEEISSFAKSFFGGEINAYKRMMNEARADVLKGLAEEAKAKGADAVIGLRFGSTQIMPATVDIFAYGTAVKTKGKK
jgi:uncharacterized protein YbjQ (UPF0145 family)